MQMGTTDVVSIKKNLKMTKIPGKLVMYNVRCLTGNPYHI